MTKEKVLITGARGFVGKNLVNYLKNKNYTNLIELSGKEHCDLTNQRFVQYLIDYHKPEVIIHTAARVGGILANSENPGLFIYENLAMGVNIIETARKYGKLKKFVMLGTVCSYPKFTPIPFREEDLWNGYPEETNAPYGVAKKTILEMLIAYQKQYGFESTTLVPCNMYGPEDNFDPVTSHVIPAIILKIKNAKLQNSPTVELWGTGNASREFLYVQDCSRAIESSIEANTGPEPINIGTGHEITIKELASKISKIMQYNGEIVFNSNSLDGQPRRSLDISRAKTLLKFIPEIYLDSGLEETINWYLNKGKDK
jgi:nucleoside-diphosphate-sugar epimerase